MKKPDHDLLNDRRWNLPGRCLGLAYLTRAAICQFVRASSQYEEVRMSTVDTVHRLSDRFHDHRELRRDLSSLAGVREELRRDRSSQFTILPEQVERQVPAQSAEQDLRMQPRALALTFDSCFVFGDEQAVVVAGSSITAKQGVLHTSLRSKIADYGGAADCNGTTTHPEQWPNSLPNELWNC